MLLTDPPTHTRLRALVNRAFTARRVSSLEGRVTEIARGLLAGLADQEPPEVVAGFTAPLPISVIGELLGVPEDQWADLAEHSRTIREVLEPIATVDRSTIDRVFDDITSIVVDLADERLADPQDDLITSLVQAEVEGQRLTRTELVSVVALLMFAGHETTTGALGERDHRAGSVPASTETAARAT